MLDKEKQLFIPGPVGVIEAVIEQLPQENNRNLISLICHPHPLHGGNMNNKVVTTLSKAYLEMGALSVRFNYRGVGNSEGIYGNVVGEVEDAFSVLKWVKEEFPGYAIALGGFSFGGAIAIRVAQQQSIDHLVTVAPAAYLIDYDLNIAFDFPWLLVQGWSDEVIKIENTLNWCMSLEKPPEVWCLPDAEHFFHGKLVYLKKKLIDYLKSEI